MPRSLAPLAPADQGLPRDFGRRGNARNDRWPAPLAAAFIVALSCAAWLLIYRAGAALIAMFG